MKKKVARRPRSNGSNTPEAPEKDDSLQTDLKSVLDEIAVASQKRRVNQWTSVQCPYCGENFEVHLDTAEDDQVVQEDCQICCRPIELSVHVEEDEVQISASRS